MDKLRIRGGRPLKGQVEVSGSKNAALPILISSLLTDEKCRYTRVPDLNDIGSTLSLIQTFGAFSTQDRKEKTVEIHAKEINRTEAVYDLVRKMRASFLVMGPLLARTGRARVSLPGGCAIGTRPVDFHLHGMEKLGAKIELDSGYVNATAKRLIGNRVVFSFPSVGAVENVMMAATLAKGETVLENCAREPEVVDLANALIAMGAEIEGAGTERILIQGKDQLRGCQYRIMGDRIEAGTYLSAAMITHGDVTVLGLDPEPLAAVLSKFEETGAKVELGAEKIRVTAHERTRSVDISTQPFPGFPTDMQAQFMALMALAGGVSSITENIFENRFMHVPELVRLGADITVQGRTAVVKGVDQLRGAPLMATDLRASASLVLAGLQAEGETWVNRVYHLDRGYEHLEDKLRSLGADIERLKT